MKKIVIASLFTVAAVSANAALVGYWNFDNDDLVESSGFTAAGTHDGVVAEGTVAYTAGHTGGGVDYGRALDLSGGGVVSVLNSNGQIDGSAGGGVNATYQSTFDADLSNGPMSIAFWATGQPGRWLPFVANEGEAAGYQVRQRQNGPNLTFTLRGTDGTDDPNGGSTTWNDEGGWHHIAAVWDIASGNRLLYIDGALDGSSITDGSDTGSVTAAVDEFLVFGARDAGGTINGISNVQLDEIGIYNHALSESEVQALAIPEPGTLGLIAVFGGGLLFFRRRFKR